jgi:hypothetical protein
MLLLLPRAEREEWEEIICWSRVTNSGYPLNSDLYNNHLVEPELSQTLQQI